MLIFPLSTSFELVALLQLIEWFSLLPMGIHSRTLSVLPHSSLPDSANGSEDRVDTKVEAEQS